MVQLTRPCMTTGKTIALTIQTFVGIVMSLFFNILSKLVVAIPRSKRLLISWLQSPSAVIFEPPKMKSATVSTFSPSICHEVPGHAGKEGHHLAMKGASRGFSRAAAPVWGFS